jgi:hypothetical protein
MRLTLPGVLAHQMQAVPVPRAAAAMWASCAST